MARADTALRITELDFSSIRNNIKNYLRSQDEFLDYDFEGSGLTILLDILAYNTHYMGYYINMIGNEMFLDTAQIRASVLSHAKHIGYVPTSMKGAQATVNITITPQEDEDTTSTTLTIPKYTTFTSEPIDGISYTFATVNANTSTKANGAFQFNEIVIREGSPVVQQYIYSTTNKKFTLPSANVDTSTLTVSVQESSTNTSISTYTLADDLTEMDANTKVYFIEESFDTTATYTLYFGDGVIGKAPKVDNIIIVKYLDTNGEYANRANNFLSAGSISGYGEIDVESVTAAAGGAAKETIEQTRFRAPYYYSAQNRAVTRNDYEALILKDYQNIDAVSIWSGDENDPPVYGKVFISLKPKENYEITLVEKERIKKEIIQNRAVLTVTPELIDPDYTYLLVNATVNYNPNITNLDDQEIKQLVRQAILDYRDDELKTFDSTFRMSKLQKYIDTSHESILGSAIQVFAQKRITLTLNKPTNYSIDYKIPLYKGYIEDKLYTYPEITSLDNSGSERDILIEDTPNSLTGIDSLVIQNAGSGYLTIPTVKISGDGTGATAKARIVNGKIAGIDVVNRGQDYTRASVTITSDTGYGATASVSLQAKNGILRSFYFKTNGEKVIVNPNIGTIDYNTGKINLILLSASSVKENDRYDNNVLVFNATPYDKVIRPLRNRILDIDENDISSIAIKLVSET